MKLYIDEDIFLPAYIYDVDLEWMSECSVYHKATDEGTLIKAQKICLDDDSANHLLEDSLYMLELEYVGGHGELAFRAINLEKIPK